jgi:hypothetical protein
MKKLLLSLVAVVLLVGLSTSLKAQINLQTTTAAAKIVTAIALTEVSSLHFGTMTIPTGALDLVLTTGTVRNPSIPANITLLAQAPVAQNAAYTVAGAINATYAITLPANGVVTISNGTPIEDMAVKDFVARTASAGVDGLTGTLDGVGADSFVVGATLVLANAQPAAIYTGTFDVSVNYN